MKKWLRDRTAASMALAAATVAATAVGTAAAAADQEKWVGAAKAGVEFSSRFDADTPTPGGYISASTFIEKRPGMSVTLKITLPENCTALRVGGVHLSHTKISAFDIALRGVWQPTAVEDAFRKGGEVLEAGAGRTIKITADTTSTKGATAMVELWDVEARCS
ncbi:hypothetical protein [Demequina maris]|uniref:hypothetical protein n=1 Tax=Demequina maris TaxID=1638982 RepID=UPI000AE7A445|nr:hypothetical protein [Demequina maris]